MKIILVEIDDAKRYPPEISILNALNAINNCSVKICSLCPEDYIKDFCSSYGIELIGAGGTNLRLKNYSGIKSINKIFDYNKQRTLIWNAIDSIYEEGDFLWINTFMTLKLLGNRILKYKYIVHLFELVHDTRYYYKFPYPKYDIGKYLQKAYRVIECEYNRACITQAWFELKRRPVVVPNKFYLRESDRIFKVTKPIEDQIEKLKGKKIILYQGILGKERPIEVFSEAVYKLGEEFVMLVMSNDKLDVKYDNTYEIGFINPPNHLYVTQKSYIGILNYQAARSGFSGNDCLNSIYCAPNKIFEYSRYGLPMIGNDIPGLKYTLGYSKSGICVKNMTADEIMNAIKEIDKNYEYYNNNSLEFYKSVDIKKIIEEEILNEV